MEIGRDLFLVVLGWVLGIGSPLIVENIKSQFEKRSLRNGINTELRELQLRLAMTAYLIVSKQGIYDRDLLNWMADICSRYASEDTLRISETLKSLLVLNDQQLQSLAEAKRAARPSGLNLKSSSLPFLDSNIAELGMFDTGLRQKLIEVRAQLGPLNEEIELARFYFEKTFDSTLTPENYNIINDNIRSSYDNVDVSHAA
jgi:hypothetical protein